MIPMLNDIAGVPSTSPQGELEDVAGKYRETLWTLASTGDATARRQVVELRIADLIRAYAG
jgi:hypothetical protein